MVAIGPVGPLERDSRPITPDNPIPRRVSGELPAYPSDAGARGERVQVSMLVTLDGNGRAAEVRLLGEPRAADVAPFERAALDAVRQWIYESPVSPPITFMVGFGFMHGSETRLTRHDSALASPLAMAGLGPPPSHVEEWRAATTRVPPRRISAGRLRVPPGMGSGERATVVVHLVIGVNGRVSDVRVVQGSPHFSAAALEWARTIRSSPALADGMPIPFTIVQTISFSQQ